MISKLFYIFLLYSAFSATKPIYTITHTGQLLKNNQQIQLPVSIKNFVSKNNTLYVLSRDNTIIAIKNNKILWKQNIVQSVIHTPIIYWNKRIITVLKPNLIGVLDDKFGSIITQIPFIFYTLCTFAHTTDQFLIVTDQGYVLLDNDFKIVKQKYTIIQGIAQFGVFYSYNKVFDLDDKVLFESDAQIQSVQQYGRNKLIVKTGNKQKEHVITIHSPSNTFQNHIFHTS